MDRQTVAIFTRYVIYSVVQAGLKPVSQVEQIDKFKFHPDDRFSHF
jgi:hypothetical protein